MRIADRVLLAEYGPYTAMSQVDGAITVLPTRRSGGVVTRLALARIVAAVLNTAAKPETKRTKAGGA